MAEHPVDHTDRLPGMRGQLERWKREYRKPRPMVGDPMTGDTATKPPFPDEQPPPDDPHGFYP